MSARSNYTTENKLFSQKIIKLPIIFYNAKFACHLTPIKRKSIDPT